MRRLLEIDPSDDFLLRGEINSSPSPHEKERAGHPIRIALMSAATARCVSLPESRVAPGYNAAGMPQDASKPPDPSHRAYAAQLYERHSEGLMSFFRAALPMSRQDATDLLQQTFLELLKWKSGGPDRAIQYPRAFLYRIALRRLSAYREKKRRIPDTPAGIEPALDERTHRDDLDYLSVQHDSQRQALRAMRRLEPDAQVILYLRFWAGLTEAGIGEALGRGRATVAGQLRRAKRAMVATLEQIERAQPGKPRTSTTMLERWWRQVEAQARQVEPAESAADQSAAEDAPKRGTT